MRKFALLAVLALAAAALGQQTPAQGTSSLLDEIRSRGVFRCSSAGTIPGFSFTDAAGNLAGFDFDFCRAVAARLGLPLEHMNSTSATRFDLIRTGAVDVVFRSTTHTITRDQDFDFGPVTFFDGQSLLVKSDGGINGLDDLEGTTVCVQQGSTSEQNIADQVRQRGFSNVELLTFSNTNEVFQALLQDRCDVMTTDASQLASFRATAPDPPALAVVGGTFSDEPLAPFTRENDSDWADFISSTVWALVLAEELGITSGDVATDGQVQELAARGPVFARLLTDDNIGGAGIVNMLRTVGNYGEIYERAWGPSSPTAIARAGTRNMLAIEGGAITSRPFR